MYEKFRIISFSGGFQNRSAVTTFAEQILGCSMFNFFKKDIFRKLGYVQDQRGIWRRYRREKTAWQSHLESTKSYIQKQCSGRTFKSVAVLGSGYLLDLPLTELLACSDHVFLYDVNHPKKVLAELKDCNKITFVKKDITGMSGHIGKLSTAEDLHTLLSRSVPDWKVDDHDCIISLNILNQLDILLLDYIQETMQCPLELEVALREKIQSDHIASLGTVFSILIADTREVRTDLETQETTFKSNLHTALDKFNQCSDLATWQWFFDNSGRYIDNSAVKFEVNAVTYNKTL